MKRARGSSNPGRSAGTRKGRSALSAVAPRFAAASVLLALSGCGFARLFFDLPEPTTETESVDTTPRPAWQVEAFEDSTPAPIEAVEDPDSILALLPRDGGGYIDWVAALRDSVVRPRRGLPGTRPPPDMRGFAFDFRLAGPNEMFDAVFSHSAHVEWLTCQTCHPGIFPYRGDPITMADVNNGEACGVCHGPVAFPTGACFRCHEQMPPSGRIEAELGGVTLLARQLDTTRVQSADDVEQFPRAGFSHWSHRIRYRCSACHPGLFKARAEADTVTMLEIGRGEACGACHNGNVAFGSLECGRCHVPQAEGADAP